MTWDTTARPVQAGNQASSQHVARSDPLRAGSRDRGTSAHAAPPGHLGTALRTEGCGTGDRDTGSTSVCPSGAPPAPAHPTCTGEGAQLPPVPSCNCCPPRDVSKADACIPKPQSGACREGAPLRHAPPVARLSGFTASSSGGMCRAGSHGGCRGSAAAAHPTKATRPSGHNPVPREPRPQPSALIPTLDLARDPRGDVAQSDGFWGPATTAEERGRTGDAEQAPEGWECQRQLRTLPVSTEPAPCV